MEEAPGYHQIRAGGNVSSGLAADAEATMPKVSDAFFLRNARLWVKDVADEAQQGVVNRRG